jgi:Zn ribbon nucleic-acid-binding protein
MVSHHPALLNGGGGATRKMRIGTTECPCCKGDGYLLVWEDDNSYIGFRCTHCKDGCGTVEAEIEDAHTG